MPRYISGEQLAQVDNPDPFASPVWRSPVHRTPEGLILLVQFFRTIYYIIRFIIRHPLLDAAVALISVTWLEAGWPGLIALASTAASALLVLRCVWPGWYARLVTDPLRRRWRWWFYRRRWHAVMSMTGLAPDYRGRVVLPRLGKVTVTGCTDRIVVTMVSGQSPADFADRAEGMAHGFRAHLCPRSPNPCLRCRSRP
jgi:S-DNA-T family DNA segregation ATPase FtsK/SpoIIIE